MRLADIGVVAYGVMAVTALVGWMVVLAVSGLVTAPI